MKTKQKTKEIKREREFKDAERDLKDEFDDILGDDFLDEKALCLTLAEYDED